MPTFVLVLQLFILLFHFTKGEICASSPQPSLIQNSELLGTCLIPFTAADKITRDATQETLSTLQKFSFSGWVKILSTATQNQYSLFRLTQDTTTTSATTDTAVILTVLINRSPSRQIIIQYAQTGINASTSTTAFAFTDDTWFFIWVSYNSASTFNYIYYAAWLPNISSTIKISNTASVTHVALTAAAVIEVLYWGTYTTFCGHLNRFIYYPSYVIQSGSDWMIQALSDPSKSDEMFLYLKFESADSTTQNIIDFSGQNPRNDAVLGYTSAGETGIDPVLFNQQGIQGLPGRLITITDHKWSSQDGFVLSFYLRMSALTLTADADTTDAIQDILLITKKTGANTFKVLVTGAPSTYYIKIIINGQIYTDTVVINASNQYQISISVALYTSATDFYNYYIIKIDYAYQTPAQQTATSGYIQIQSSVQWDESSLGGLTVGSSLNSYTGGAFYLSSLKVKAGLGVYYGSLSCITNCAMAFAKYNSISCLACSSSYFESNGICSTICDTSGFGLKNSYYNICSTCGATCLYCNGSIGSEVCTACKPGYYLNNLNACVLAGSCPAGYVGNPITLVCTQCGNSTVNAPEQCDDGNFNDYDGCTNCIVDPFYSCDSSTPNICDLKCGNGIKTAEEECDDGNYLADDGCTDCIVDIGFSCDASTPNLCSSICGNGVININEECDDGNTVKGDGCSDCRVEIGYVCTVANPSVCTSQCQNGVRDPGEQCDDGNSVANDGCTSCKIDQGYICINGSSTQIDNCSVACFNGKVDNNEECDDNNGVDGDGCSSSCTIETDYTCSGAPSVCTHVTSTCGDGLRTSLEACDIGPAGPLAVGCTGCIVDSGFLCYGGSPTSADTCIPICGDGFKVGNEACDDGNVLVKDGCDQNCNIEENYTCIGGSASSSSTCINNCGDGVRDPTEECDDENQTDGDGCSQYCTIEVGYSCTQIVAGGRDSCYQCAKNCLVCSSKSIKDCTTCFPGFYKNLVTGTCDFECSDGYFGNDFLFTCDQCYDSNCKKCFNSNKGQCFSCLDDLFIAGGTCYEECPFGYYSSLNPILGKQCTTCTFPCAGCTSATDCFQCGNLYYLDEKTGLCNLCNMGPNCYSCDISSQSCTKCAIGYRVSGKSCEALPQTCGDGYFQPTSEACDDGNTVSGDGCSSTCTIESNYACILANNEGPSECYEKRATKVSGYMSQVDYHVIFVEFERELKKKLVNLTQSDIIIKVSGLKSRQFNYTSVFLTNDTIKITFNYSLTVRDSICSIDFSKSKRQQIEDKYNYTLVGNAYEPITVKLPYYIFYTSSEIQVSKALSWVFIGFSLISIGPILAYLYNFSQGRVFKYIEVLQVIGLFRYSNFQLSSQKYFLFCRFFNIRWDILSYNLFQQIDLVFNFRGFYNVFSAIPIGSVENDNFANVDSLTLQRQSMNSSFLHSFLGSSLFVIGLVAVLQGINNTLYKFIENDKVSQVTEKIKEFSEWDVYVKLFEFLFFFYIIATFLSIQSFSFATPLAIVNFVLAIILLVGMLALGGFIIKKRVRYDKLKLRTDWFDKYLSFFDGIKFNMKRPKIYLIFPYIHRTLYAGVLIFLHDMPFFQILGCASIRLINIIVMLVIKPFHFPFIQRRDIVCELFLILMILLCLNCTDDNSVSSQKRIMAIIFLFLSFVFIFGYAGLYYWTVKQDDIYFDPVPIVPLRANPADWASNAEDKNPEKDEDGEEKIPIPLQNMPANQDGEQDDFGIAKQPDFVKPSGGIVGNLDDDEEDIFAPKANNGNQKSLPNNDGEEYDQENSNEDINNFQR